MSTKSAHWPVPYLTLALTGLSLLALLPGTGPALQYVREFTAGSIWRVFTCHFVHWSVGHAFWSIGAFGVLGCICEARSRARFALCLLTSAVLIPLGLFVFQPGLAGYRGLSGIDSALFMLAAIPLILANPDTTRAMRGIGMLLVMGFATKLIYEQLTGGAVFVRTGGAFVPVPLAHLIGSSVGAAFGLAGVRRSRHCADVQ